MAYVYILYSKSINRFYIGSCFDLSKRMNEHRNGVFKNSFTVRANDWELYYVISDLEYRQAREIESHIKK